jgi:PAP2 superfamily
VREDYSSNGEAWQYLPHDHARSKAYRWNEDGIAGICDRHQYICFALALWNEKDPILKERLFGLTGSEGNHGEDVKEYYFYLDSTPTHSYLKFLDVKMFFALTNAVFDAGIAAWDAKRAFDSVRPVTAVPYLFHGTQIQSWGGPGQGTIWMDGSQWIPYQPSTFPTPPFPEYISGHSTFSAAGATILFLWTGSDQFGDSVTFPPGSSTIEPGITPKNQVTLQWRTFTDAANEAGISRRYGGIHFKAGDLVGRAVGDLVGLQAWARAQVYFNGH